MGVIFVARVWWLSNTLKFWMITRILTMFPSTHPLTP